MTEHRRTLRALLFDGEGRDVQAAVMAALEQGGVSGTAVAGGRRASSSAWRFLKGRVGDAVKEVLDLDVGDVLLAGWQKQKALRTAAQQTLASPGTSQVVDLACHTVTCKVAARVDVVLDETCLARVPLDLTITAEATCLAAVVRDGRLVELDVADLVLKAALSVEQVPLPPKSRRVDAGLLVTIPHGGLPLLAAQHATVPQQTAPTTVLPTTGPPRTRR